jgi:hypothetical protein
MASISIPSSDPHVAIGQSLATTARGTQRSVAHRRRAPGALLDELLELEEQMVETPLTSRAGWISLAEVVQYDLTRELPADSFGLRAVAVLVAGVAAGL